MTPGYNCEVCGTELEYSGRGRPPKLCAEHKGSKSDSKKEGAKVPAARPAPGARPAPPKVGGKKEKEEQPQAAGTDEGLKELPPVGSQDTKSRAKAEVAAKRTTDQTPEESWPIGLGGRPMIKVSMSASELIPTGQYANVSVGPAQIHAFVDLDRPTDDGGYFTESEKDVMKSALNELAETVERDVIAVQRNLVLESMQEQLNSNGSS